MARWIKIYDGILDWEWHARPEMVSLFVHLLIMANTKDGRFEGYEIKRGELVTSIQNLSETVGCSVRTIRTCLEHLQQTGEIVKKSTNRFTIITICKYDLYQENRQATDKRPTSSRQATDKRPTTILEYKNREYKNIDNISSYYSSFAELSPGQQEEEKKSFYEIFFFRNYTQLNEEVDRFIASNESKQWKNKSGKRYDTPEQRIALAQMWKQMPAQDPRIKIGAFLPAWKKCYERCKAEDPDIARSFLNPKTDCIDGSAKGQSKELMVMASSKAIDWLSQDADHRDMIMVHLRKIAGSYGKEQIKFYSVK